MGKNIRHGDLALISVTELPEKGVKSKTNVVLKGSHGNEHYVKNCDVYLGMKVPGNPFGIGYIVAKEGAILYHVEHGKEITKGKPKEVMLNGTYALIQQHEIKHNSMQPVVD